MNPNQSKDNEEKVIESQEVKELSDELGKAIALDALRQSEGGKALIAGLVSDIVSTVDMMATQAHVLTHTQFIAFGCRIKERLDIARALSNAKSNREFLQDELKKELDKQQQ